MIDCHKLQIFLNNFDFTCISFHFTLNRNKGASFSTFDIPKLYIEKFLKLTFHEWNGNLSTLHLIMTIIVQ